MKKEYPIRLTGDQVRAVQGKRKTQHRILVKLPIPDGALVYPAFPGEWRWWDAWGFNDTSQVFRFKSPYVPGDRLWVKETFSPYLVHPGCWYWADGNESAYDATRPKPSIHMPRILSRITLEITGVRLERLQEISEEDAEAEGCTGDHRADRDLDAAQEFRSLWDSINGKRATWESNPWVWVVEFKQVANG